MNLKKKKYLYYCCHFVNILPMSVYGYIGAPPYAAIDKRISNRGLPRHATAGENTGADICNHKYAVISSQSSS